MTEKEILKNKSLLVTNLMKLQEVLTETYNGQKDVSRLLETASNLLIKTPGVQHEIINWYESILSRIAMKYSGRLTTITQMITEVENSIKERAETTGMDVNYEGNPFNVGEAEYYQQEADLAVRDTLIRILTNK